MGQTKAHLEFQAEEKVQQRVEHYCDITVSFLQLMMQNGTRKMLQLWFCRWKYVEAGKGSLSCPCTKTSLPSICSEPSPDR